MIIGLDFIYLPVFMVQLPISIIIFIRFPSIIVPFFLFALLQPILIIMFIPFMSIFVPGFLFSIRLSIFVILFILFPPVFIPCFLFSLHLSIFEIVFISFQSIIVIYYLFSIGFWMVNVIPTESCTVSFEIMNTLRANGIDIRIVFGLNYLPNFIYKQWIIVGTILC